METQKEYGKLKLKEKKRAFSSLLVLFKFIFKIDFKEAKSLQENKELEKITDKFPENIEIAKEMLEILGNEQVKIEEAKDTRN